MLAVIALASVVMAGALVKREFFPVATVRRADAEAEPRYVADWKDALPISILDGRPDAPMTVVVLSDLECPACARFSRTLDDLRRKHPDDVTIAFVHWPLERIHRFALPAARAAECADAAGRFQQFARAVYARRDSLGLKSWGSYAAAAGIADTGKIAACARSSASSSRIVAGSAFAQRIEAVGTPTVLVNGWQLGHVPLESDFESALAAVKRGSPPFANR